MNDVYQSRIIKKSVTKIVNREFFLECGKLDTNCVS